MQALSGGAYGERQNPSPFFAFFLLNPAAIGLIIDPEGFWDVMKRIENKLVGVDQGELVLFSDYESGGDMWTGSGDRIRRHSVRFTERFSTPPAVHVALSMWDIDSSTNARMEISAEKVTVTGFDCVFRTWADTHVARARMRWMAIGELVHEDNWELY